jgi:hypothetical protein
MLSWSGIDLDVLRWCGGEHDYIRDEGGVERVM